MTTDSSDIRTKAFIDFVDDRKAILELVTMANLWIESVPVMRKYLPVEVPALAEQFERFYKASDLVDKPEFFQQLWMQIVLARMVDSFNAYLSNVLHLIFEARPEILKSSEKVEVKEVLECGSIDEFARYIAARKVEELSYTGLINFLKFMTERIGLEMTIADNAVKAGIEAIAGRNIIVHNRAVINRTYIESTGRLDVVVGELLHLDTGLLEKYSRSLEAIAKAIDDSAILKFGVRDLVLRSASPEGL